MSYEAYALMPLALPSMVTTMRLFFVFLALLILSFPFFAKVEEVLEQIDTVSRPTHYPPVAERFIVNDEGYLKHFKEYLIFPRHIYNQHTCAEEAKERLESRIARANNFNKKLKIPSLQIEEWGRKGPNEIEKKAAANIIAICKMSAHELRDLARSYDYGRYGIVPDKEIAIGLYYYLHFTLDDVGALYRLKDLGANVVTEPLTTEEGEALDKRLEEQRKEIESRNMDESIKEIEKEMEEMEEMEIYFLNHILPLLIPLE